jgi:hypothetical protein
VDFVIEQEPRTMSCHFQLVFLLLIIRTTSFALIYANINFCEEYLLLKTVGTGALPSALKRPGLETDHSPPTIGGGGGQENFDLFHYFPQTS